MPLLSFAFAGRFAVRQAREKDEALCLGLMHLLFPLSRTRLLPGDIFLIAEDKGVPAGFCHFRLKGGKCYIAGLGVLLEFRNHGIGSLLLSRALLLSDSHGAQSTTLHVRALNQASNLYAKFGFFEKRSGDTLLLVRKRPS